MSLGIIRVLTTTDDGVLGEHGRLLAIPQTRARPPIFAGWPGEQ